MDIAGYELEVQIGRGSSGTVWRARSTDALQRPVAVKRVGGDDRDHQASRLRREASILAELDHPHIVRVHGVVDDGAGVAIVMQYAPGGSLEARLERDRRLSPERTVAVLAPIADALASAHRAGVLHGDVKPGNILFTSDDEALLSDFGVARWLAATDDHAEPVAGTAEYLAPELVAGGAPDVRSDVYAVGVVVYEALAGRPPFTGATDDAVLDAVVAGDHVPLTRAAPGVPPALADVVEAAMSHDPAARPASAADLAAQLRGAMTAHPPAPPRYGAGAGRTRPSAARGTSTFGPRPPRTSPAPDESSPWSRRLVATAVVVGVVVAEVAGVGFFLGGRPDTVALSDRVSFCPGAAPGDDDAGGPPDMVADVDGDGRGDVVRVLPSAEVDQLRPPADGCVVEAVLSSSGEEVTYGIDRSDGHLGLFDRDCDGVAAMVVYRPSDGLLAEWAGWAHQEHGATTTSATRRFAPGGTLVVEEHDDGCERLRVEAPA